MAFKPIEFDGFKLVEFDQFGLTFEALLHG